MSLPARIAAGVASVAEKAAGLAPTKLAAGLAVTAGVLAGGVTLAVREPSPASPTASERQAEPGAPSGEHESARVRSALLPPLADSPPATAAPEPEPAEAPAEPRLDGVPKPGWPSAELPGSPMGELRVDAPDAPSVPDEPPAAAEAAKPGPGPEAAQAPTAPERPAVPDEPAPATLPPSAWTSVPQPDLRGRGEDMLSKGDVAQARLWLSAAADKGDAEAMMRLAETYDPAVLGTWRVVGLTSDPAQARALYERALAGGVEEAREALERLGRR